MEHVVVAPRAALAGDGYALPAGGASAHGTTALPRVDGAEDRESLEYSATQPPVSATQPPVSATQPPVSATQPPVSATQPPWGWGAAPARTPPGETPAQALTDLPTNPTLYTARQQDAARRDIAARLGCYAEYSPEPFV